MVAKTLTFEADVTVPSGVTYTVDRNVTNTSYQVVFEHGAYLMQQNDNAVNIGNISFKRQSEPIYRLETLDWSSPVFGQNILALSLKHCKIVFIAMTSLQIIGSQILMQLIFFKKGNI